MNGDCLRKPWLLVAALAWWSVASSARAEESSSKTVAKARELVEKHKDALVTVKLVISVQMVFGGREQPASEQRVETEGTVLGPDGLTLISNSDADPSHQFRLRGKDLQAKSSVKEVKIALNDGKELEAAVVLKDEDLDLAFVRPKKTKELKLPHLELAEAPEPKLLDECVIISRLDQSTGRAPVVATGRVMSIIRKPRLYYRTVAFGTGQPVFDGEGKLLGITLRRAGAEGGTDIASFMPVVLPAADIKDALEQVPQAKNGEEKQEGTDKKEEKPGGEEKPQE